MQGIWNRLSFLAVVLAAFATTLSVAQAAIQVNQNVTPDYFNGTGIANGRFTTDQENGIELGLRAHVRAPDPLNEFRNDGTTNVYGSFDAIDGGGGKASWNFDWSINVGLGDTDPPGPFSLDNFTYLMLLDIDPGPDTDFRSWDPINDPLKVQSGDHAFGNNLTTDSTGENDGDETIGTPANYAMLISDPSFYVAQNSGNYKFFNGPTQLDFPFDPTANGIYDIVLKAFARPTDGPTSLVAIPTDPDALAQVNIQVIVGDPGTGAVPEATALLTWGGLALCGGIVVWRKKARAA